MARGFFALALALGLAGGAEAHKSSDAYLLIDAAPGRVDVRWDIALRDLDVALDIDADADGKLTWREVRAALPRIEAYAAARLAIDGCRLVAGEPGFERRNDGAYVALHWSAACTLAAPPRIAYSLFAEVDPTHRGLARIRRDGREPELLVLTPVARAASESAKARSAGAAPAPAMPTAAGAPPPPSTWQFLGEGVRHILGGYDHVLFLLCLLLPSVVRRSGAAWRPVERWRDALLPILGIVTAFTIAHSITLGLAALQIVSLPPSIIEPAIAVTIVLAALDNLLPIFPLPRYAVAFAFGLVHGFGFAGVLTELELPRAAFAWALLQFNLGLEAGQLIVVGVATTVLFTLRRSPSYPRWVVGAGSVAAIAIALAWFVERTANVSLLPF